METGERRKDRNHRVRFKSYYVVWKLGAMAVGLYLLSRFKSYYVVWKLEKSDNNSNRFIRLNRTM